MLLLERPYFHPADQDGAERAAFADQRHAEDGTVPELFREFSPARELVACVLQVGDVNRLLVAN